MTLDDLKVLIIESLQLEGITPNMIGDDEPLFGTGLGLDSVDALELVVALERRLGVKIRASEVDREVFESASNLHRFLESRTTAVEGSSG